MPGSRLVVAALLLCCACAAPADATARTRTPPRRRNVAVLAHDTRPGFDVRQFPKGHSYQLLDTGFSDFFALVPGGILMTTADLRPLLGRNVTLAVLEDGGVNRTLEVAVLDRRDMLRFEEHREPATVAENAPAGTHVAALEPAAGWRGGPLLYRLLVGDPGGAFRLEADNGSSAALVTAWPLDREQQADYELTVEAEDALGLERAITTLRVFVLDENDNGPVFSSKEYRFPVDVGWVPPPGRFRTVGKVSATDADGDRVVFSLGAPSRLVVIVPQTGELLLAGDPPQEDTDYEIVVEVHDLRSPSRTAVEPARVFLQFNVPPPVQQDRELLAISAEEELIDDIEKEVEPGPDPEEVAQVVPSVHRITKRRVTRAVRPTKRIEFTEADGETEGRVVFQLEKETERETFKIRDENPWVTVEPNGAVRVKKKWDYEELGPEKTIDFWVTITNAAAARKYYRPFSISSSRQILSCVALTVHVREIDLKF
ncbi:neural-cadherin-like [Schistocerca gregaria]|uniref:neural-cadherin-like n=1 Tax=Schistocerca gregaria TaxID=7010 RepID=UPI00211E9B36|nr:neural-cadherin-like [Schistocerca gregaria]